MQTDVEQTILSRLKNVRQRGDGKWMASSPTRRDRNPSLSIRRGDDGKILLHDFGGSTVEEIVSALGIEMSDLFVDDNKGAGWIPMTHKSRQYAKPSVPSEPTRSERMFGWFEKRGITKETVEYFGIYLDKRYFRKLGKESAAIAFPYRKTKSGEEVNIKFRSPQVKDFSMWEDAEPCFYNLWSLSQANDTVIVVEGEMDVLAMHVAGFTNAISPPGGCESLSEDVMLSGEHVLANDKIRVILAGDMDDAGERMMETIVSRVGKERCSRARWPEGCKDANDTLMQHGAEAIVAAIEGAEPYPVESIITVRDVSQELWQLYDEGLKPGISTGIASVDRIYTVAPGQFTIVTGPPGSGKTTMLDNLIVNIGGNEGWPFGICSMENRRLSRHLAGIAQKYIGKPFREGFRERMSTEELLQAEEWMDGHVAFVKPREATMESILSAARALVYRKGMQSLIIDPWNRIRHPQSMNSGDYVADALNRISEFADHFNVHVFLVAHPTKLSKGSDGNYPPADGYDISGSANFNNMADYIVSMWRDSIDATKPPIFYVKKSRYDEIAQVAFTPLGFDRATGRYYDLDAARSASQGESVAAWHPTTPAEHQAREEEVWEEFVHAIG